MKHNEFIYIPENYPGPIALDIKPSKELKEYHQPKNNDDFSQISFFPPPWNIDEHPEKTEGWIEFQKALREDPAYYLDFMRYLQSKK